MKNKNAFANSVIGLIFNLQILPGLGSLIGGKKKEGIIQAIAAIVSVLLMLKDSTLTIGIILMIAAWLWGLMTGITMVRETAH